jgi:hypothetical protein
MSYKSIKDYGHSIFPNDFSRDGSVKLPVDVKKIDDVINSVKLKISPKIPKIKLMKLKMKKRKLKSEIFDDLVVDLKTHQFKVKNYKDIYGRDNFIRSKVEPYVYEDELNKLHGIIPHKMKKYDNELPNTMGLKGNIEKTYFKSNLLKENGSLDKLGVLTENMNSNGLSIDDSTAKFMTEYNLRKAPTQEGNIKRKTNKEIKKTTMKIDVQPPESTNKRKFMDQLKNKLLNFGMQKGATEEGITKRKVIDDINKNIDIIDVQPEGTNKRKVLDQLKK